MGTLRTVLALLVVVAHVAGLDPNARIGMYGGVMAVNAFFVISGFYMTLILTTKYQGEVKTFYFVRALRLYPLYWAVIAVSAMRAVFFNETGLCGEGCAFLEIDTWEQILVLVSNVTFVGMDALKLITLNGRPGWNFLFVPQAWTLGSEVLFYLIIPWILRLGWKAIAAAIGISLLVNGYLVVEGLYVVGPWTRRFFPSILIYFMLGVLSFYLYERIRFPIKFGMFLILLIVLIVLIYSKYYQLRGLWVDLLFYPMLAIYIPFLFAATKNFKWDNWIGEWSYPIYISHFVALLVSTALVPDIGPYGRLAFHLAVVLGLSGLGLFFVVRPMERVRSRVKSRKHSHEKVLHAG